VSDWVRSVGLPEIKRVGLVERCDRFRVLRLGRLSRLSVPVLTLPCNGLLVQTSASVEVGRRPLLAIVNSLKSLVERLFRILYAGFAGLNEFSAPSYSPEMFAINICIQDPIEPVKISIF